MKPSVGDRLECEVTKLVHGGRGLARHDGFVVFVSGVLPGERVTAEVTAVKKSHAFADAIEVTTPSPHRIPHVWPEADLSRPPSRRAGGADYGHISLDFQRQLKTDILRDALARFGKVDQSLVDTATVRGIPGDHSGLHWRTRVTLHVGDDGIAGPYVEGSHQVIPVASLPLATEAIEQLAAHRTDWTGHQTIRLVDPSTGGARIIVDRQKPQPIEQQVGSHTFQLSDHSFWQVHHGAASTLWDAVSHACHGVEHREGEQHWDLYGGVGLFAATLLNSLGHDVPVVTVESDADATQYASVNLAGYPKASAITADATEFVAQKRRDTSPVAPLRLGVVVMDPPRSGATKDAIVDLIACFPRRVIYVACDPVALGRDLSIFAEHGYKATRIEGFDLFPHTHHMEAVAVIEPERARV